MIGLAQQRCFGCMKLKNQSPVCELCGYDERSQNAPNQLPVGTVLKGQYQVGKALGQGGFGITYLGWDVYLNIPIAIKEYYPSGVVSRESTQSLSVSLTGTADSLFVENRARFLREAQTLAMLEDVSEVVQVKNFFQENNTAYIIMGYVKGITLKDYMRQRGGILSVQETFRLLKPLMEALQQVHDLGLVHRDISPDNIMVQPNGKVRLIDFGAAHEATQGGDNAKSTQAVLKYGFAPIEQYQRKGTLGPWTDVYAFCATIYHCLTGKIPPHATDRVMGTEDFEWGTVPGLTQNQIQVLRQGLELHYQHRIQSMSALCNMLFAEYEKTGSGISFDLSTEKLINNYSQQTPLSESQNVPYSTVAQSEELLQNNRNANIRTAPIIHELSSHNVPISTVYTAPIQQVEKTKPVYHTTPVAYENTQPVNHTAPVVQDYTPHAGSMPTEPTSSKKSVLFKFLIPAVAAIITILVLSISLLNSNSNSKAPSIDSPAPPSESPVTEIPPTEQTTPEKPIQVESLTLIVSCPDYEMTVTQQMIQNFANAHPEYDCSGIEVVAVDSYDTENMLLNDPDSAPDILQLPCGAIDLLSESGLLHPINVNTDQIQQLYGYGAIDACSRYNDLTKSDLMYGIPISPNTWFVYYNNTMYTEEEIRSLETMLSKELGNDIYNFSCQIGNSWYIEAFFYAAGCNVFGPNGDDPTQCDWNSEAGLAAANYIYNLSNHPKYIEDNGDGTTTAMMKEGKLAALCSGSWSYPELYQTMGDTLSACALPTIIIDSKECQLTNFADYTAYCIKSNTRHPMAAQELAAWLCNDESQLLRYQKTGTAPCALSLLDNPVVASNAGIVGLLEQTAFTVAQPSIPEFRSYWRPAELIGDGIINGSITPNNMQSQLNSAVRQIIGK